MKSVISKDIETLFLYKNANYSTEKRFNIVLSPEFYWCRVFDIPVQSKKQIKKILPTLFEDILPHTNFEYYAVKLKEKKYICFAYDNSAIVEKLKELNLNLSKLHSVYFAQTELMENTPFKVEQYAYIKKDENLIQVPIQFIKDELSNLNLKGMKLSSHKIKLNIHQNIVNLKNVYILSGIFFIIALINFVTIISLNSEFNALEKNKQQIIEEYNLPRTSIQLNSIINSLKNTNKEQIDLREALYDILKINKRYPNTKIHHIEAKEKISLEIKGINFVKLKDALKSYKIKELSNKDGILKVEINL